MTDKLPRGWEWVQLQDIAAAEPRAITDGPFGSNLKTAHYTDDGPRVIRLQNIGDGVFKPEDAHISQEHYESLERHAVRAGDLIVASLGEVLPRACLVPDWVPPAIVKADCIRVRLHSGVNPAYINFALQLPRLRQETAANIKGVGRPRLGMQRIKELPIPLASRAEQDHIVAAIEEHFSRLDAAERSLEAADGRFDALYRSVAVDALARPEWGWTTLGEIAEVKGGITKDSKRETDPEFEEFPYLRVANVQRGYLDLSTISTIRVDPRKARRLILRSGDILFNEGGDRDKLGRGWVWEGQIDDCIHQNHVFRARLMDDSFDPYFVSLHANSWGQRWFETHGKQTTNLASLSLTTLKLFPVPAPPLGEQQAVVSRLRSALDSVQRQRLDLECVAARASALRSSILVRAFEGKLLPPSLGRESASAMLENVGASAS